jgi:hypothetical protein
MERLDKKVEEASVRDGSSFPVPYFPYLRSNRFLSAFENRLQNAAEREYWLQQMRELGTSARRKEIRNLPDEVIFALESMGGMKLDQDGLYNRVESCSRQLMDHDRTHDEFYKTLYPVLPIPDQYSLLMRAVGLYPITSLAVTLFTARVREESRSWFHADTEDLPVEGKLMSFSPANEVFLQDTEIEEIIHRSTRNPHPSSSKTLPLPMTGLGELSGREIALG